MGLTDDAIRSLIRNTLAHDVVVQATKNKLSFGHGLGDRSRAQALPFFIFLPHSYSLSLQLFISSLLNSYLPAQSFTAVTTLIWLISSLGFLRKNRYLAA